MDWTSNQVSNYPDDVIFQLIRFEAVSEYMSYAAYGRLVLNV